uniref:Putative secreted protein n=1 Tax=Ixodes ricinus TaxID=34613 RepID=A0A6B0UC00_IXORI
MKPRASTAARLTSSFTSLTATWSSLRTARLLPDPQYAMARACMADRRSSGSLSPARVSTRGSASSRRPYRTSAMPTDRPRRIFSCWVSWA